MLAGPKPPTVENKFAGLSLTPNSDRYSAHDRSETGRAEREGLFYMDRCKG